MPESAAQDIHSLITRTADAYFDISSGSPSTSALYHARFLRNLVDKEVFRTREVVEHGRDERFTIDPNLQGRVILGICSDVGKLTVEQILIPASRLKCTNRLKISTHNQ